MSWDVTYHVRAWKETPKTTLRDLSDSAVGFLLPGTNSWRSMASRHRSSSAIALMTRSCLWIMGGSSGMRCWRKGSRWPGKSTRADTGSMSRSVWWALLSSSGVTCEAFFYTSTIHSTWLIRIALVVELFFDRSGTRHPAWMRLGSASQRATNKVAKLDLQLADYGSWLLRGSMYVV